MNPYINFGLSFVNIRGTGRWAYGRLNCSGTSALLISCRYCLCSFVFLSQMKTAYNHL
ncbi:hypothetical protein BRADI_1g52646v3 [Brachypodium distachyon]|uniref:Uncharacterized protein n=1 Tax=Brachypodium distachyon TaxID=15368 RepID=A0A0Q3LAI0_BRADI|nr:hypothetical protein BRADI_1g52646v3 [Brachypodium distachyon]